MLCYSGSQRSGTRSARKVNDVDMYIDISIAQINSLHWFPRITTTITVFINYGREQNALMN